VKDFLAFVLQNHYGDLASIVGLAISIIGFGVTLWAVFRAKSAAQAARDAVKKVSVIEVRTSAVADCSTAIQAMQEIERLHRDRDPWQRLPDRYTDVVRLLIAIKANDGQINEVHKVALTGAISQFQGLKKQVERVLVGKATAAPDQMNGIVASQIQRVQEILNHVRGHNLRTGS
jgi:hypothetical protein